MGSTNADIDEVMKACPSCQREWFKDEMPQHKVYLDAFWIDQTEVTNAMFAQFVAETNYQTDAEKIGSGIVFQLFSRDWKMIQGANWRHPRGPATDLNGLGNHPVVQMSGNDSEAYCAWAGRRLPTEAEWGESSTWNRRADISMGKFKCSLGRKLVKFRRSQSEWERVG